MEQKTMLVLAATGNSSCSFDLAYLNQMDLVKPLEQRVQSYTNKILFSVNLLKVTQLMKCFWEQKGFLNFK